MITRLDRILLAAPDRGEVAARFRRLLDAETLREDSVKELAGLRTVLRLGASEVEILEPDGAGPVEDHVARERGGPLAVGLATRDVAALSRHLEAQGVRAPSAGNRLYLRPDALGIPGLFVVISRDEPPAPAGRLIRHLYEVTHLTDDAEGSTRAIADRFGARSEHFVPIASEQYGYRGTLTLFDPARLDRIETIHPHDRDKTMGRYFERFGASLYMSYAETDAPDAVRERLLQHAPRDWTGPREGPRPDNLFIHPRALGGVMLGVSRTTHAWTWSGHPDRVRN